MKLYILALDHAKKLKFSNYVNLTSSFGLNFQSTIPNMILGVCFLYYRPFISKRSKKDPKRSFGSDVQREFRKLLENIKILSICNDMSQQSLTRLLLETSFDVTQGSPLFTKNGKVFIKL